MKLSLRSTYNMCCYTYKRKYLKKHFLVFAWSHLDSKSQSFVPIVMTSFERNGNHESFSPTYNQCKFIKVNLIVAMQTSKSLDKSACFFLRLLYFDFSFDLTITIHHTAMLVHHCNLKMENFPFDHKINHSIEILLSGIHFECTKHHTNSNNALLYAYLHVKLIVIKWIYELLVEYFITSPDIIGSLHSRKKIRSNISQRIMGLFSLIPTIIF